MNARKQSGFAIVELLLIIVILGIIAFVAWRVILATETVDTAQAPQGTIVGESVPQVTSANDLADLEKTLDNTNVEGQTITELDTESSF
ncbi:MAG: prepilin-type N-terminal cleavage/methylation domain-containing protein [Candidatus Saccharimonadales bacterium]